MASIIPGSVKTVHVIGDSHALGFKGKSIVLPDYGFIVNASVEYVRGLTADKLVQGRQLLPELVTYFLRQGIITKEGLKAAATEDSLILAEQYSTGSGFQRPVVIFTVGEIFVRKYLGSMQTQSEINFSDVHDKFREVVQKYVADVKAIQGTFGIFPVIHEICPPTGDDQLFEQINKFRSPRELRATAYGIFNQLLLEHTFKAGIAFCRSADYLAADGFLADDFEFDGVHADPRFAYTSLERAVSAWLHNRISEKSERYLRWCERIGSGDNQTAISRRGVSEILAPFAEGEIAALRKAVRHFDAALCKVPALDWAHLPPTRDYGRFNDSIKYGEISSDGLRILHDVLIKGVAGETIRSLFGAHYSIINVRPVHSMPHVGDGIGQQAMHRDGCPPGVYRGLIYLDDVDENNGPFEYVPTEPGAAPTRVTGKAGSMIVFDANAVLHRATPPRKGERLVLDLIFLAQPESCTGIADCRPGFTWPVDPYMFSVSQTCYPALKGNQWFYPALVVPREAAKPAKMLTAEDLAPTRAAS